MLNRLRSSSSIIIKSIKMWFNTIYHILSSFSAFCPFIVYYITISTLPFILISSYLRSLAFPLIERFTKVRSLYLAIKEASLIPLSATSHMLIKWLSWWNSCVCEDYFDLMEVTSPLLMFLSIPFLIIVFYYV